MNVEAMKMFHDKWNVKTNNDVSAQSLTTELCRRYPISTHTMLVDAQNMWTIIEPMFQSGEIKKYNVEHRSTEFMFAMQYIDGGIVLFNDGDIVMFSPHPKEEVFVYEHHLHNNDVCHITDADLLKRVNDMAASADSDVKKAEVLYFMFSSLKDDKLIKHTVK